jgi:hypothetical protein
VYLASHVNVFFIRSMSINRKEPGSEKNLVSRTFRGGALRGLVVATVMIIHLHLHLNAAVPHGDVEDVSAALWNCSASE